MMHILFKGSESRNRIIHATGIFLDQETQSEDTGSQLTHVERSSSTPQKWQLSRSNKIFMALDIFGGRKSRGCSAKKTWTLFKKRGTYKQRHLGLSYQVPQAMVY